LKIAVSYALPFRESVGIKEETYEVNQDSATVARMLELIV